ncbi:MAG: hypothetical protein AB7P02_01515 [Alphaproteobacteria bacterium]
MNLTGRRRAKPVEDVNPTLGVVTAALNGLKRPPGLDEAERLVRELRDAKGQVSADIRDTTGKAMRSNLTDPHPGTTRLLADLRTRERELDTSIGTARARMYAEREAFLPVYRAATSEARKTIASRLAAALAIIAEVQPALAALQHYEAQAGLAATVHFDGILYSGGLDVSGIAALADRLAKG